MALQGHCNDANVIYAELVYILLFVNFTPGPTVSNEHKPSPDLLVNGQKFAVVG